MEAVPSGTALGADRPSRCWIGLLLIFAAMLPFVWAVPFGFIENWDDDRYILLNPWLGDFSPFRMVTQFFHPYYFNYHPLTILSYQIEHAIWGAWAPGYRMVNMALHGLTTLTVLWLIRQFGAGWVAACGGALFFAVHPLRLESVVWISERKDVLCGLFYLLALDCWRRSLTGREGTWLLLSVAAALLAFFSKAMAVSLPLVLIAHDLLFARQRLARLLPIYLVLLSFSAVFAWLNMTAQQGAIIKQAPLLDRFFLAAWAPVHYLQLTLWPFNLAAVYPMEFRPSRHLAAKVFSLLFCIACLLVVMSSWRRFPRVAFSLLAAGLALGPVAGIVSFGSAWAADRYSYVPTALLLAGLVPVSEAALQRRPRLRRAAVVGGAVLLAGLAVLTSFGTARWASGITLWSHNLSLFPEAPVLKRHLAEAYAIEASQKADPQEAAALYERALNTFPAEGRSLLALVDRLQATGRAAEIPGVLHAALEVPDIMESARRWAQARLGLIARAEGREEEAKNLLDKAFLPPPIELPTTQHLVFLAWFAEEAGYQESARALYLEAVRREPLNGTAHEGLAFLAHQEGKLSEALEYMGAAVAAEPSNADFAHNLARMQAENSRR